ncbi:Glyoxalase/Bleomycin resistance protein/Dihydroxybiphenyl dioxygenase [Phlyctochytrium arcticum]|nr:Glyoxalase/Bleomycin resistance protein/Dihydroxybiphenyl dioxygenase [Phlyctochytrium arcticum]
MSTDPTSYQFNHTMVRVKDPKVSIPFYEQLGMSLISKADFEESKFTLYFLGYNVPKEILAASEKEKTKYAFTVPGILELTHNWGTESDPNFEGYKNGNQDPHKGYGHIGIIVDNVEAACDRLIGLGVNFVKKPSDGKMKEIAFCTDPDGYWIEILPKSFSSI